MWGYSRGPVGVSFFFLPPLPQSEVGGQVGVLLEMLLFPRDDNQMLGRVKKTTLFGRCQLQRLADQNNTQLLVRAWTTWR
jgi:hypothetical protein